MAGDNGRRVPPPVVIGTAADADRLLAGLADYLERPEAGSAPGGPGAWPWDLTPSDHAALVELLAQITHSVERCADGIADAGALGIPAGQQLRAAARLASQSWRQLQGAVREAGFGPAAMGFPVPLAPAARVAAIMRKAAAPVLRRQRGNAR